MENIPHKSRFNSVLEKLAPIILYAPAIMTLAFIVQTFVVRYNMSDALALALNYMFGLSMLPMIVLVYYAFTKSNNYINKVCSIGNLFLCTTNFIYVLSSTQCIATLVNRLLGIEVCIMALVSIYLTINRYDRDNKRTVTKSNSK